MLALGYMLQAFGAPIATCDEQYNCIKASLGTIPTSELSCGQCTYRLCVEIDYRPGCSKSSSPTDGEGLSHACVKPQGLVCAGDDIGFGGVGVTRRESEIYDNGDNDVFRMCQYGDGGQRLNFLLKDGSGCADLSSSVGDVFGLEGAGIKTSCTALSRSTDAQGNDMPGCGGGAQQRNMECVWTFTLPPCGEFTEAAGELPNTGNIVDAVVDTEDPTDKIVNATGDTVEILTPQGDDMLSELACAATAESQLGPLYEHTMGGEGCGIWEVSKFLAPYQCSLPNPGCPVLYCELPLPGEVLEELKACIPVEGALPVVEA